MKALLLSIFLSVGLVFASADAINFFIPGGYPTDEAVKAALDQRDYQRAMTAYRFFYPTISVEAVFNANRVLGIQDNTGLIYMAGKPHHVFFTGNSDTPYAAGVVNLTESGPMVIELPAGPFMALALDHNQGWIADMGLPGPDQGKGGRHLILPPNYQGQVPQGYFVGRSKTNLVLLGLRIIPKEGEGEKALDHLTQIKVYPLNQPAKVMAFTNITEVQTFDSTPLAWENNIEFWKRLHKVVNEEVVSKERMNMQGLLIGLGIEKGKEFAPDARMTAILERAARDGRDQMLVSAWSSDRADRFAWEGRRWEWASLRFEDGAFSTPSGIDLEARDRWFIQATGATAAMFRRDAKAGSLYWLGHRDQAGAFLDGGKSYRLRVPKDIPAGLFWSITVYDSKTRSYVQTDQGRAAIRSLFEKMTPNQDGTIDLYFGPTAPKGMESQWVKTNPGDGWFSYFRIYGPQQAAFDGTWKLNDFEEIQKSSAAK